MFGLGWQELLIVMVCSVVIIAVLGVSLIVRMLRRKP